MIYEERIYTIQPGKIAEYMKNYEVLGLPVQKEVLGTLVGFWHTDVGGLNKVVHIWGYDSLDDRLDRRATLAAHPDWPAYLDVALPLIVEQENRVLIPASFSPAA
ncbi:MAG: NIPSNAP family protein [Proteobacteria bacterium]|nr:NIPSNAP family protein [Pseudomonadota bacterium]